MSKAVTFECLYFDNFFFRNTNSSIFSIVHCALYLAILKRLLTVPKSCEGNCYSDLTRCVTYQLTVNVILNRLGYHEKYISKLMPNVYIANCV